MRYLESALRRSQPLLAATLLMVAACGGSKLATTAPTTAYGDSAPAPGVAYGGSSSPSHVSVQNDYSGGEVAREPAPDRPGLGTSWGEQVDAPITFAPFVRSAPSPWAEAVLHYNDEDGAEAHAAFLGSQPRPLEVFAGDGSIGLALVDDAGRTLPGFEAAGRALVIGEDGQRYRIVVRNGTSARFEIVASVDGLDVIDGKPADPNRRGYIVDPHDSLVIDGFRTSSSTVAAFRFGAVAESYAAQTSGDRNVGVVGFAIFSERGAVWTPTELSRRDTAEPFPQRGYATPPR